MVPIVMGAHPADYVRAAPPHSFVNVDWFDSQAALARYLSALATDPAAYARFFAWRRRGALLSEMPQSVAFVRRFLRGDERRPPLSKVQLLILKL